MAVAINPQNRMSPARVLRLIKMLLGDDTAERFGQPSPDHLALLTSKYWGQGGVHLTVGFPFEDVPLELQQRILSHMNAWSQYCNASFTLAQSGLDHGLPVSHTGAQVRISLGQAQGGGYWSYLGTDILGIPADQPTMNLEGFSMATPESEYHRVVRHETGHTLGFPHEHLRAELIARLDPNKTIIYFLQTQGWTPQETIQQVLTPLAYSSIRGTDQADQESIMCYQLPASITKDGQPITGGIDIDALDQQFAASIYPQVATPPAPPPKPSGGSMFAQILALLAAVRGKDYLRALGILLEVLKGVQSGAITEGEMHDVERALTATK